MSNERCTIELFQMGDHKPFKISIGWKSDELPTLIEYNKRFYANCEDAPWQYIEQPTPMMLLETQVQQP